MALRCEKTRAKTFCSLEHSLFVLLNDKSRMIGDFHVWFCEKFEVGFLLLTRLRGWGLIPPSYSLMNPFYFATTVASGYKFCT